MHTVRTSTLVWNKISIRHLGHTASDENDNQPASHSTIRSSELRYTQSQKDASGGSRDAHNSQVEQVTRTSLHDDIREDMSTTPNDEHLCPEDPIWFCKCGLDLSRHALLM